MRARSLLRRIRERNNGSRIKAGFPRFKSGERYNSITYPQSGFRILDNGHVWLSRIVEQDKGKEEGSKDTQEDRKAEG